MMSKKAVLSQSQKTSNQVEAVQQTQHQKAAMIDDAGYVAEATGETTRFAGHRAALLEAMAQLSW